MGRKDIHIDGKRTRFSSDRQPETQGRPKGVPNAATRYKRFLELVQAGKNPVTGADEEFTVAELMDLRQIKKALDGDLQAYKEILDRLEGKAKQPVEMSGNVTATDGEFTDEQLNALQAALNAGNGRSDASAGNPVSTGKQNKQGNR